MGSCLLPGTIGGPCLLPGRSMGSALLMRAGQGGVSRPAWQNRNTLSIETRHVPQSGNAAIAG